MLEIFGTDLGAFKVKVPLSVSLDGEKKGVL